MTSLDSYITLGRSGLRVSPLTLGTMTFGEDSGWGASPETSEAILAEYLDRGGNVVDTANIYTNGHSEKIVGEQMTETAGSAVRVRPSPAWRVIDSRSPASASTHPSESRGRIFTAAIGRIVQEPGSIDLTHRELAVVSWGP